ncbi:transglutaminase family protein [Streptomyces odontomachi]|uniref:transglutaminase family protein n=1 Tax=Streptomyces odontomachi TaxID=2944940 RepID=UPI00210E2661|nr:transglutaminase-like domain-containing protein [Streptomyces sp. ODS25]
MPSSHPDQPPHDPHDPQCTPRPPEPERAAEWRRAFAVEARSERPDLARLCLLVAAQADGALDEAGIDAAQVELDRLAGELPFRPGGSHAWARALAGLLGGRYDFRGTPGDYRRLDSSLLHTVLRRRRGLPILLSVVWIEVARRAGAPVYGVALPGHFVVGIGPYGERAAEAGAEHAASGAELSGQVLVDPFHGGRVLTDVDTQRIVAGAAGTPLEASMLRPADPLDVVVRILNNIRAWAAARPEHSDVALWAVELMLQLPSHPARLRQERAELLVQRGEYLAGAAEFEAYAKVVGAVDRGAADVLLRRARAARAMLN